MYHKTVYFVKYLLLFFFIFFSFFFAQFNKPYKLKKQQEKKPYPAFITPKTRQHQKPACSEREKFIQLLYYLISDIIIEGSSKTHMLFMFVDIQPPCSRYWLQRRRYYHTSPLRVKPLYTFFISFLWIFTKITFILFFIIKISKNTCSTHLKII